MAEGKLTRSPSIRTRPIPLFSLSLFMVSILLFPPLLFAIPADVEDLSNRAYFPAVLKELQTAQKSIHACFYYISYTRKKEGKVDQLMNALIEAKKRTVDVQVILDQSFEKGGKSEISKKNARAVAHLQHNAIPVFYDDLKTLTHAKYWILDGKTVISGSFNLSEQSLSENRENATLIRSPELAEQYLKHFQDTPKLAPESLEDDYLKYFSNNRRFSSKPVENAVPIPRKSIREKKLVPRMTLRSSPRAVDCYLLLQKLSFEGKSAQVTLTRQEILDHFFYRKTFLEFKTKDPIPYFKNVFIQKFQKEYGYIESTASDLEKGTLTVTLKETNTATTDSLALSKLYWEDRWDKRLKPSAKAALLIVLDRTDSGRKGRYFEEELWHAAEEYGMSQSRLSVALQELQRYNLIEKTIRFEPGKRQANGYQLNDFYRMADFEKSLAEIREKNDPETFRAALRLADLVDEPKDLDAIGKILELGKGHGVTLLKETIRLIEHKEGISPYRRLPYVLKLIENKALRK